MNQWLEWFGLNQTQKNNNHKLEETAVQLYKNTLGSPMFVSPAATAADQRRYMINADATASGFFYQPIETFLSTHVLPFYNNTHSNAFGGQMMSLFMEKSKDKIKRAVSAAAHDKILFTGNGCTGAIQHVIHMLNLRGDCQQLHGENEKPVVLISEAEHHSNDLPWRHLPIDLVIIPVSLKTGLVLVRKLHEQLQKFRDRKVKLISMIAVSNITGVIQPIDEICMVGHKFGATVMFDYATGGAYIPINMNTHAASGNYIDIVVLSMHKFLGGPMAPGVLIVKAACCLNKVPFCPGGGTVRFVSNHTQTYSSDIETRENGGTPNIVGGIKAGLCFELKQTYQDYITAREQWLLRYIQPQLVGLAQKKQLELLNPLDNMHRIPIFSFRVPHIHYNLVVALLSDLFGIQTRGGISCCSMYAQKLLGISDAKKKEIQEMITQNKGVPAYYGWCRITFHYSMPQHLIDYILRAVTFVATNAHKLQHFYTYHPKKNNWTWTTATATATATETLVEKTIELAAAAGTQQQYPSAAQLNRVFAQNQSLLKRNLT